MGGEKNFQNLQELEDFCQDFTKIIKKSVSLATRIPTDLSFYSSSYPDIGTSVSTARNATLSSINSLIDTAKSETAEDHLAFQDSEDIVDRYNSLWVDVLDSIFERVNSNLDVLRRTKNVLNSNSSAKKEDGTNAFDASAVKFSDISANNPGKGSKPGKAASIPKPQLQFMDNIDNSDAPFVPKISFKPNARSPLELKLVNQVEDDLKMHLTGLGISAPRQRYSHPYEFEISSIEYPTHMLHNVPEILYQPLENTKCTFVDSLDTLEELKLILDKQVEFAVDLENHDYRSYQGFCCLIQISTRTEDFIIDALNLRSHLQILNSSFTNPSIVKVFHGAEYDIKWLQRDFGLYVVNLFDTFHAATCLKHAKKSLSYLVGFYVGIEMDKTYQTADWRTRPIPELMLKYAQEDTHYLLYVYDRMRNALVKLGGAELSITLQKSAQTSLKIHEKPIYTDDSYKRILLKFKHHLFSSQDVAIFKSLHKWRDDLARKEDESPVYVLSNHLLFAISISAPVDINALVRICNPMPPLVRIHAKELVELIKLTISKITTDAKSAEEELEMLRESFKKERGSLKGATALHLRFSEENEEKLEITDIDELEEDEEIPKIDENENQDVDRIYLNTKKIVSGKSLPVYSSKLFFEEENVVNKLTFTLEEDVHFLLRGHLQSDVELKNPESERFVDEVDGEEEELFEQSPMNIDIIEDATPTESPPPMNPEEEVIVLGKLGTRKSTGKLKLKDKKERRGTYPLYSNEDEGKKKKKKRKYSQFNMDDISADIDGEFSFHKLGEIDDAEHGKRHQVKRTEEKQRFDPYSKITVDEKFKKKDPRLSVKSLGGGRQMTFKKPK